MESKYINVYNSKMHYLEKGEGQVFLFIHGNPSSSYIWRNIIEKVSKYRRCIAVDLIGMGKSDKVNSDYRFKDHYKYLDKFIKKMDLKNIILVLHDWGSGLGFNYYKENQENVKGIVFMEAIIKTHKNYEAMGNDGDFFKMLRDPNEGKKKIIDENFFVEAVIPGGIIRKLSKEEHDVYRMPYLKKESRKPLLMWPNEVSINGEPKETTKIINEYMKLIYKSEIPKLLLYAKPGAIIKQEEVEYLKLKCKNLKTRYIGEGIHFLQEDNPEKIANEIIENFDFLNSEYK